MNRNELLSLICKNNADEQDAIKGYFLLKSQVDAWCEEKGERYRGIGKDINDKIDDIISEEMKHTSILIYITEQLSDIHPEE